MKLKNLLNISIILSIQIIFFSCSTKVENVKNVENKTEIKSNLQIKDSLTIFTNNDTSNIELIIDTNKTITIKNQSNKKVDKTTNIKEPSWDKEPPKEGTEYIICPKARVRDSINLFIDNYSDLMRTLTKKGIGRSNKGIQSPIERDSLLWEEWQKIILQHDSTHKKVEYNRNMKFGNKKE